MASKTQKRLKPLGLHPFHYGIRVGDNFFPPSEFAYAWIAVTRAKDLERILNSEVGKILDGEYRREDIPYFFKVVKEAEKEGRRYSLDDLRALSKGIYHSTKMIDGVGVIENTDKGYDATLSLKDTLSVKVDSRRRRTAKNPGRNATIRSPFIDDNVNEAFNMRFEGGSEHRKKNLAKDNHWSVGLKHEAGFITGLQVMVEQLMKDRKDFDIRPEDISADYMNPVSMADYDIAVVLTYAHKMLKELHSNPEASRIKRLSERYHKMVNIPFDFDLAPRYAFDAFIQGHDIKAVRDKSKEHQKRLFGVDISFIGRKGFITKPYQELRRQGKATNQVRIYDKSFRNYGWAVIQAWEEYLIKKQRRFDKFTLEFVGTPYQTVSIVFTPKSAKESIESTRKERFSVRIIYDDNTGLPYLLYKSFMPERALPGSRLGDIEGLTQHPLSKVNWAKDLHQEERPFRSWIERDQRTGRLVSCSIYEPRRDILQRASDVIESTGYRGVSVFTLKGWYIDNQQSFKKKHKTGHNI